jgi:hypothetical protein
VPDRSLHPAAAAVANALTVVFVGEAVEVVAVAVRRSAAAAVAAVAVGTGGGRVLVIAQQQGGVWRVPSTLSGGPNRPVVRPGRSEHPAVLSAMGSTRVTSVTGEGDWVAVRAVAAEDAAFVDARSSIDSSTASVDAHGGGTVLLLVETARGEHVSLSVRTRDGRVVDHRPRL